MSEGPKDYWKSTHEHYANAEWIDKPTLFAESVIEYFPESGTVLDAGCGQGQDARFFAGRGYDVVGIDFLPEAVEQAEAKTSPELADHLTYKEASLAEPLPFADGSFDVVHSHLSSHYFSEEETLRLFKEYERVLKEKGLLTLMLNSVHDADYGAWESIEPDYFLVNGVPRRYFSAESLKKFIADFEIVLLDEQGESYNKMGRNGRLVRFVGRKR